MAAFSNPAEASPGSKRVNCHLFKSRSPTTHPTSESIMLLCQRGNPCLSGAVPSSQAIKKSKKDNPTKSQVSQALCTCSAQVVQCIQRGGKVLIPVFAVGRAQELMILVEEAWQRMGLVGKVPIFFSGHMAARANGLYRSMVRQSCSVPVRL